MRHRRTHAPERDEESGIARRLNGEPAPAEAPAQAEPPPAVAPSPLTT